MSIPQSLVVAEFETDEVVLMLIAKKEGFVCSLNSCLYACLGVPREILAGITTPEMCISGSANRRDRGIRVFSLFPS